MPRKAPATPAPAEPTPPPAAQTAAAKPPAQRARPAASKPKPPKPEPVAKPAAADKPAGKLPRPHPKLVRDSFTMPETDFAFIARLKIAALGAGRAAKKSELLRAGLRLLATLDAQTLVQVLDDLTPVKTGRPKKGR